MARRPLSVEAQAFNALFGKTSQVEPKLKAALRKRMKTAADQAAADVRAEVLKAPRSHGAGRSRGLRKGIAAGVKVTLSTSSSKVGVAIQATGSKLPPDMRRLVRAYNKPKFRHRVFGTGRWVEQAGRPYFTQPIEARTADVQAAVLAAMEDAVDSLTD